MKWCGVKESHGVSCTFFLTSLQYVHLLHMQLRCTKCTCGAKVYHKEGLADVHRRCNPNGEELCNCIRAPLHLYTVGVSGAKKISVAVEATDVSLNEMS